MKIINAINQCLEVCFKDIENKGKVMQENNFIRYEILLGDEKDNDLLVLRIGVRDAEDTTNGGCNFIYVPSIVIPYKYSNNLLGTTILAVLAETAYRMKLYFFVTNIVNERFFDYLLRLGGEVDDAGDIELYYPAMIETLLRNKGI